MRLIFQTHVAVSDEARVFDERVIAVIQFTGRVVGDSRAYRGGAHHRPLRLRSSVVQDDGAEDEDEQMKARRTGRYKQGVPRLGLSGTHLMSSVHRSVESLLGNHAFNQRSGLIFCVA